MRIFLIEDNAPTCAQLLETLPRAGLKISHAQDSATAIAKFKSGKYDVALIDLMLEPNNSKSLSKTIEYQGIHLGANIRSMDPNILIVMYSAAIADGREEEFRRKGECLDAGADKVVSRQFITSTAPKNLAKSLVDWKQEQLSRQRTGTSLQISDNFRTKAVVEKVGGNNLLLDILRQTLKGFAVYKAEALPGGYSGSIVIRVHCKKSEESTQTLRNIVKISSSRYALADELKRRPYEGSVLDNYATLPRASSPVQVENWYAFAVSEVRGALSLEELLVMRNLNHKNKAIMRRVVKELIVRPAIESMPVNTDEIENPFSLRYSFLASIDEVLKELSEYCESYRKNSMPAINSLKRYFNGCAKGYYPFGTNVYQVATLHGDLHCRNILVKSGTPPVLIDFGRADIFPRLFDFACLDVDLIIRVTDMNMARHWDPKRIQKWLKTAREGYPFALNDPPPNDCISFLRHELHQALRNDIPSVSIREYEEALVFQLFRYLRFQNIPIFKKIVCAEMTADLINKLGILEK